MTSFNCALLLCGGLEAASRSVVINGRTELAEWRGAIENHFTPQLRRRIRPFRSEGINEVENTASSPAPVKCLRYVSSLIYGNRYLCFAQLATCNFRMQRFHCRGRTRRTDILLRGFSLPDLINSRARSFWRKRARAN